jgi:hypothetical protein
VPPCDRLLPGHVFSRVPPMDAAAWIVDAFGTPHAISARKTVVGRRPEADVAVQHSSVSREHAELHQTTAGWEVRDLGSRNGTFVGGKRTQARALLGDRADLRFGEVAFLFVGEPVRMPDGTPMLSVETCKIADRPLHFVVQGERVQLRLACGCGEAADHAGGALLYRAGDTGPWSEINLPPLEFQFLRRLCAHAVEDKDSPAQARGCVPTRELVKLLPFQTRYANEENVRQVVRRVRSDLAEIGADGLVAVRPGRGYFLSLPVVAVSMQ